MKKHFILISIRNILKRKSFSIINIFGLAIGMAASILILLWIQDELSFDNYHKNYKHIYRLVQHQVVQETEIDLLENPPIIGQTIMDEIPEVENYFRLLNFPNVYISRGNEKLPELFKRHSREEIQRAVNMTWEGFEESGGSISVSLQNIGDIHLNSNLFDEIEINGSQQNVYIFLAISIFIILLACIKSVNLSTSRSLARAKEVGVKKVVGSSKSQLVSQFLSESVIFSVIALNIGLLIVEIFLPFFNNFTEKDLSIGYLNNPVVIPLLIFSAIIIGLLSGYYPSRKLSSFKAVNIIKGKFERTKIGASVRDALIVFQILTSVIILSSTLIFAKQLKFINTRNLGFRKR